MIAKLKNSNYLIHTENVQLKRDLKQTQTELQSAKDSLSKNQEKFELNFIKAQFEKDKVIRELESSKRKLKVQLAQFKLENDELMKANNKYKEYFDKMTPRMDAIRHQNRSLERKINE